jgi:hypothetical protein
VLSSSLRMTGGMIDEATCMSVISISRCLNSPAGTGGNAQVRVKSRDVPTGL